MSIIVLGKEVMGRYVKEWRGKETDFFYICICSWPISSCNIEQRTGCPVFLALQLIGRGLWNTLYYQPFVLFGAGGSGKSALLSKTALQSLKVGRATRCPKKVIPR